MAGGTFDINVQKIRPGIYMNFQAEKARSSLAGGRGIVVLPLKGYDWGPRGEFIPLERSNPDEHMDKLGRSIYEDNLQMLLIRQAFLNASVVYVYMVDSGAAAQKTLAESGEQALNLTVKAAYPGNRGNELKVTSIANLSGGYDVSVRMGTMLVAVGKNMKTIGDLKSFNFKYVTFEGENNAELKEFASVSLEGGVDTAATNDKVVQLLDDCEDIKFNCIAFPFTDPSLQVALKEKIQYFRENMGKTAQAAAPNFDADYEGIINVTNGAVIEGVPLTADQAAAFVAGITAGADKSTSNTQVAWPGATGVVEKKKNEEAILAIENGEFFFSTSDGGEVVCEYDINSLVTYTDTKTQDYRKNKIIRIYDSLAGDFKDLIPPGRYSNTEEEWTVMEGLGTGLLDGYEKAGVIKNLNKETDFKVDTQRSTGESTYFNVAVQAVDSSEKLYFTILTR